MRINCASFRKRIAVLLILLISSLWMTSCGPQKTEPEMQQAITKTPTAQIVKTTAAAIPQPYNTPVPTLLPVTQPNSSVVNAGLIIFSMSDGEYRHLFAYHPSYLSVTRLTADAWDDESPAISPDGNKIVFSSNRFGTHEIYLLDLVNNSLTQMTNSKAYKNAVSWSPDGQYIVYENYDNEHFSLIIQSVNNPQESPIQLSEEGIDFFQPAWSPDGSEIAFVTDPTGRNEIWIARLQDANERFVKVIASPDCDYSEPSWSQDGLTLAITRRKIDDEVIILQPHNLESGVKLLGKGRNPVWMPDDSGIMVTLQTPNLNELLAYSSSDRHLILPPIPMPGNIHSADWKSANLTQNIQLFLSKNRIPQPVPLWADEPAPTSETGRRSLVTLDNVNAPQPSLSDAVDDNFNNLRETVKRRAGWDVLASLENAVIAATEISAPDISENWLYTGRAIALNMAPYEADYLVTSREEISGEIYWRVWIKCKEQDGTCGQPIQSPVWDFSSRSSGDTTAYENGGKIIQAPGGYWVDFTDLALRYGWERIPSLNNWRSYFPGIQFNVFVLKQGFSWRQALLDIYPPEQVDILIGEIQ